MLAQLAVEFAGTGHTWAQAPQLFVSAVSSTQKPLHSEYPWLHVNEHALVTQAGFACATAVEQVAQVVWLPQAPTAVPGWQVPPLQQPLVHAAPQPPQLL